MQPYQSSWVLLTSDRPQNSRPRKRSLCITQKTSGILALLLVNHFVRVFSLVMSAIVLQIWWAYESRENTNFSFNSGLQRFVFIILKPDRATFAISLVFDRPMSQTMTYFSGVLVLPLMGAREAKDNISGGVCIYQSP